MRRRPIPSGTNSARLSTKRSAAKRPRGGPAAMPYAPCKTSTTTSGGPAARTQSAMRCLVGAVAILCPHGLVEYGGGLDWVLWDVGAEVEEPGKEVDGAR